MKKYQGIATILLRFPLATGFLSAVASRLGFWGSHSSGWTGFMEYTKSVNSFAPASLIPLLAIISTTLETGLAILLLIGYKTRWAALGAVVLTHGDDHVRRVVAAATLAASGAVAVDGGAV